MDGDAEVVARSLQEMKARAAAILLILAVAPLSAQQPVGDEAFRILTQLFAYDASLPLNARTLERFDTITFRREKFIIDGWRNSRVPGLIAFPKNGVARFPAIVLIDGIG
ncbi:MAG: hypothetical protein ACT4O1_14830, partial [Gemmatimonadota bacterium]